MTYLGGLYEGIIEDGKLQGYGRRIYSNGAAYEGFWSDDFPHGQGKEYMPDGTVSREGVWEDSVFSKTILWGDLISLLLPNNSLKVEDEVSDNPTIRLYKNVNIVKKIAFSLIHFIQDKIKFLQH